MNDPTNAQASVRERFGALAPGAPVLFRGGTVLTMDGAGVLREGDVLVEGERISAVGTGLPVPEGALVVDCSGGIVMPGMIDTHRHMWQTAMRGLRTVLQHPTNVSEQVYASAREARRMGSFVRRPPPDRLSVVP